MPNSPEQSQAYNDEIDLADLIRALWQGKWLVIGVTLATLALGIAYLMIAPKSYTASLNILALPNSQADVYIELNEAKIITADKQLLLTLFVEDLKTQSQSDNDLRLSIVSVTPTQSRLSFPTQAPGQVTQTVADALELANQNVNQQLELNLSRLSNKLVANNTTAIEALDLERQQKVAKFKADQTKQIATLKEQVKLARAEYDVSVKKQIALLEQQSSDLRAGYDVFVRNRIIHLSEQAMIARALDIDKVVYSSNGALVGSYNSHGGHNDYFKGYLALNQEIKMLKSRTFIDDFIPKLVSLKQKNRQLNSQAAESFVLNLNKNEAQISQLKSQRIEDDLPDLARIEFLKTELLKNKEVKSVEMMLAKTPIGTDQFSAAVYNLDTLVYKNNTKTSLILALSIVLGGMLGIFVLLIRNVLIKQD